MNISDELQNGTYSEDDATALAELKAVAVYKIGKLDAGKKIKLKAFAPSMWDSLNANTSNATEIDVGGVLLPISAICTAALSNLQSETVDLELDDPQTAAMVDALVSAGIITSAQKGVVDMLATSTVWPFEGATLRDVAEARGRSNALQVAWTGQKFLVIEVTEAPAEAIRPLVQITNINTRPLGRTVNVSGTGTHIIDLNGLTNQIHGETYITVEFFIPCGFSVSVV